MSTSRTALLVSFVLFLSGCAHHHELNPSTFPFDATPDFSSSNSISLVNTQNSARDVLFATNMGHKWYGNLQLWTDVAVEITNRELSKRGMRIAENAPKRLEMAIVSARTTSGGWGFRSYVDLKVTTGDGSTRTFVGEGPSPILPRSADAAVMRAVAAMLKDELILEYLTQDSLEITGHE